MKLVVDASVALKWFLKNRAGELHVAQALAVAEAFELRGADLFSPAHWTLEVIAVVSREIPSLVGEALQMMAECNPVIMSDSTILSNASDLSINLGHHLFDTLYHAVAIEADATLITADDRYLNKALHLGHIMHLRDFALPSGT